MENENKDSEKLDENKGKSDYETFEDFLNKQDEDIKVLHEKHVHGLKSALDKEREAQKKLTDELKDLREKAEKGSELETKLTKKIDELDKAEQEFEKTQRKLSFLEKATQGDVGCGNPNAAWAVAQANDCFDKDGNPDFDEIKKVAPELFRKTSTDAGKRTPVTASDINADIRRKAGYK
jgi:predicted ribosome quality control (RQC) complex YloA/Tae2 family protein